MVFIAMLYILLHEEGHYWEGHLNYDAEKWPGITKLDEVQGQFDNDEENNLSKIFEWQADRHGVQGVIDVMLQGNNFLFSLPSYCNEPYWIIRSIMTAVGAVTLIFEKARQIYGSSRAYPSPRTRCVSALLTCMNRIQTTSGIAKKFNSNDIFSGFLGSLYDLMVAGDLLPQTGDLADFGPGIYPVNQTPQTMEFIKDENEIVGIFNCILEMTNVDVDVSAEVRQKWFGEFYYLLNQHDSFAYEMLAPFRRAAHG
jgi:hypothetical protein